MRIATWNVNSIRARLDHLAAFVQAAKPNVVCLQETKVADPQFPAEAVERLGYPHRAIRGEKGRNGVAVLADRPFATHWQWNWWGQADARHLAVVPDGEPRLELHCFYVPSGGPDPDVDANPKFAHKLGFIDEMTAWARDERVPDRNVIILGDLNIAPLDTDVWNHQRIKRQVGHTPRECERMLGLREAGGFTDVGRHFIPPEEHLFTWWGYRHPQSFQKNYGWRLDHVWVSPQVRPNLAGHAVWSDTRGWHKPSDHVPVVVDLA